MARRPTCPCRAAGTKLTRKLSLPRTDFVDRAGPPAQEAQEPGALPAASLIITSHGGSAQESVADSQGYHFVVQGVNKNISGGKSGMQMDDATKIQDIRHRQRASQSIRNDGITHPRVCRTRGRDNVRYLPGSSVVSNRPRPWSAPPAAGLIESEMGFAWAPRCGGEKWTRGVRLIPTLRWLPRSNLLTSHVCACAQRLLWSGRRKAGRTARGESYIGSSSRRAVAAPPSSALRSRPRLRTRPGRGGGRCEIGAWPRCGRPGRV